MHEQWKMKEISRRTYPAGQTIFHESDVANCAYLLKSGAVEITTQKDGKPILLTTIRANQIFGELALIDASPRSATATAIEATEVVVIKAEDLDRQLNNLDGFMKYWVTYLTERVRELSKRIEE